MLCHPTYLRVHTQWLMLCHPTYIKLIFAF